VLRESVIAVKLAAPTFVSLDAYHIYTGYKPKRRVSMKTKYNVLIGLLLSANRTPRGSAEERSARRIRCRVGTLKKLNTTNKITPLSDARTETIDGRWTTGRHDYDYKADSTWRMLPTDISTAKDTWRIENHQLIEKHRRTYHYGSESQTNRP